MAIRFKARRSNLPVPRIGSASTFETMAVRGEKEVRETGGAAFGAGSVESALPAGRPTVRPFVHPGTPVTAQTCNSSPDANCRASSTRR